LGFPDHHEGGKNRISVTTNVVCNGLVKHERVRGKMAHELGSISVDERRRVGVGAGLDRYGFEGA
jgi:hypothetical protein